jgi:hypothetical protein
MIVEMVGLDERNNMYDKDVDFIEAWKSKKELWSEE